MKEMITWNRQGYFLKGQETFLICGEVHYFRVEAAEWENRLLRLKEAGCNCVSTYVPWAWHEPEEGCFRLGDTPQRDLEGFLTLCARMELPVICRPGPYQYTELKYYGLPPWLCRSYPQIIARKENGQALPPFSVSYRHPVFMEKARTWLDFICPVLARHTQENGGPIALVQFDNELMGVHEWFGGWDYSTEAMGIGLEGGAYPRYLEERYQSAENVNQAYGSQYRTLAEVDPAAVPEKAEPSQNARRRQDYQAFYFSQISDYAGELMDIFDRSGISCPLIHNAANPGMIPYFREMIQAHGPRFLLGVDLYFNLHMDWESYHPTPKLAVKMQLGNEMLRLMGYPPTTWELQAGSHNIWPPITAENLRCWYMLNLAYGAKGWGYYMLSGGYNPEGLEADIREYDYDAAVGAEGEVRPKLAMMQEMAAFLRENPWLRQAERTVDFRYGLAWEDPRSAVGDEVYAGYGGYQAWQFLQKGLLTTAQCASYAGEAVDISGSLSAYLDKPLVVTASDCMDAEVQTRLAELVQQGGRLLLLPTLPHLDRQYRPCTILRDFLGGSQPVLQKSYDTELEVGELGANHFYDRLWTMEPPEGASILARETAGGQAAAWYKSFPGGGAVLWFGAEWRHGSAIHLSQLSLLMGTLGANRAVACDNPSIWTALRSDGQRRVLFLINLHAAPMTAGVVLANGSRLDRLTLEPMECRCIPLI